jgi:putative peptidoglycan lipid II flippase
MLIKVLAPGFFGRQDTRTPVMIGAIAMGVNMALSLLLVWHLRHAGLALATSAAAWVNAGLLWRGLYYRGFYRPDPGWLVLALRLVAAGAGMGVLVVVLARGNSVWWQGEALARAGDMALIVVGGALVYAALVFAAGLRPRHLRR